METKRLPLSEISLKFAGEDMTFAGYASVFGQVDAYGDTISPQAYDKTIDMAMRSRPVRMRWNHRGPVIGKWKQMFVDETGLFVEGQLTPGHSVAIDTYASLKHGAIDGLSIGYIPVKSTQVAPDRRRLDEIDLIEISVVEEPADQYALITSIKSAIESAQSVREVEVILRDSGMSRADATILVSRLKSILQGELASEEKAKREISELFVKLI